MRDALGILIVAGGVAWVLLSRDRFGLVIAFAGLTLLAYGVIHPSRPRPDGPVDPPIF